MTRSLLRPRHDELVAKAGNLLGLAELAFVELVVVDLLELLHAGCRLEPLQGLSYQPPVADGPSGLKQVLEDIVPAKNGQLLKAASKVVHHEGRRNERQKVLANFRSNLTIFLTNDIDNAGQSGMRTNQKL